MGQAELHAIEKNAALQQLEEDMTNLALQKRDGICEPSASNQSMQYKHPSQESLVLPHPNRDVFLCVVCMEREKKVLLLPCKHVCMCKVCSDEIVADSAQCLVCREHIVDLIDNVFV